jgi:hypothetical protein
MSSTRKLEHIVPAYGLLPNREAANRVAANREAVEVVEARAVEATEAVVAQCGSCALPSWEAVGQLTCHLLWSAVALPPAGAKDKASWQARLAQCERSGRWLRR